MVTTCRLCPPKAWKAGFSTVSVRFWYRSRTTTWDSTPYLRTRQLSRSTGTASSRAISRVSGQGDRINRPSRSKRGQIPL